MGNESPGFNVIAASKVVANNAKIINTYMRKLRGSRHLADRPNAWRGRLQPFVDLDVAPIGQLDPSQFEPNVLSVWTTPRRNQQMTTSDSLLHAILLDDNMDSIP